MFPKVTSEVKSK